MYAADLRTATAIRDHRATQRRRPERRATGRGIIARLVAELRGQVTLESTSTPPPVQRPAL